MKWGNVELFELCETIPKVQCSECLLYWNQGVICCTCGHLLVESESSQNFGHWRVDALSIPHYAIKREDSTVFEYGKTGPHKEHFCGPTTRGRDVSKRIMKEFTVISNEIQPYVSQLQNWLSPKRSASQWIFGTGRPLLPSNLF